MKFIPYRWFEKLNKTNSDMVYKYQSKWPIYNLSLYRKTGLWYRFNNKVIEILEKKIFDVLKEEDVDNFLDENIDVEFEMIFFQKSLSQIEFFKFKNKVYCYVFNNVKKNDTRIDVRFFFNVNEFLTLDLCK